MYNWLEVCIGVSGKSIIFRNILILHFSFANISRGKNFHVLARFLQRPIN